MRTHILTTLAATFVLAACGGGSMSIAPQAPHAYTPTAGTRYSYTQHATASRLHRTILGELHIGGDIEPREKIDLIHEADNGIGIYMGASRDGVGVHRLENYEADLLAESFRNGFHPFSVAPSLYLDPAFYRPENEAMRRALFDSVLLLNDALPPEFQIAWMGPTDDLSPYNGEIVVSLETPSSITASCGTDAVACASGSDNQARVHLPDDMDMSEFIYPRSVIVHEMLHALGIWGHVDSVEFPDSIMGTAGEYIPNGRHIISKLDREILQIIYMNQRTDLYNDWGEWSDTSFHLMGRSEDGALQFGVALFNGLPQPWARGMDPSMFLAENRALSGSATWGGILVGFSGPAPITGTAELEVDMATVATEGSEHDLRFRDIFYLSRFENQDLSDGSPRWFTTRNMDYKIQVIGNGFLNFTGEGHEQGWVSGAFMGAKHEHMAGTVKRTDMVGAFGGSR